MTFAEAGAPLPHRPLLYSATSSGERYYFLVSSLL
jgi:hypothetical protein